jgi:PAS domain S-box-containing protein
VELAERLRPDLVLMDIRLAGDVDGIHAARVIADKLALPVVFLTENSSEPTLMQAQTANPSGFAIKPISKNDLRLAIEMAIHKHKTDIMLREQAAEILEINAEMANQRFALDQHAIFAITDLKGDITFVNNKFCSISGYSRRELLGQNHRLLNSGFHPREFFADLWSTIRRGSVWQGEICNRAKDGRLYWVSSTMLPLLDSQGIAYAYAAIRADITERKAAEAELLKSQEFSLSILNSVTAEIAVLDGNGVIVAVNKPWRDFAILNGELAGVSAENTQVGSNYLEVCQTSSLVSSDSDAEKAYEGIKAVIDRLLPSFSLEYTWHSLTEKRWFHMSVTPLAGTEHGVVVSHSNVSEQRLAEEARRVSQERFRAIFENVDVGLFETTPTGHITRVNPYFCALLGQPAPTFLGRHWEAIVAGQKAVQSQAPPVQNPVELQIVRRDGSVFWGLLSGSTESDETGQIIGGICTLQDITKQIEARATLMQFAAELELKVSERTEELSQRNREVQALLQAVPDTVVRLKKDGTILYTQRAHNRADQEGPEVGPLPLDPDDFPDQLRVVGLRIGLRAIAENGTVMEEAEALVDEVKTTFELRAVCVGTEEVVLFVRDITERKLREAETAAMLEMEREVSEMKSRFVSMTSHEFRTPMTAIKGAVDILKNHRARLTDEKFETLFNRINTALVRMTDMIDSVLLLSRMDANHEARPLEVVALGGLLDAVVEESRIGDHGDHRFELEIQLDDVPFFSDPQMLHHILSNLLSNAARYSPKGSLVRVRAEADEATVRFHVQDQGIGVPEADRARIFESFERGSNVGTVKGTGLGLNIVKRMTESLQGTISVEPVAAGGSCFTVVLPRLPAIQPPA